MPHNLAHTLYELRRKAGKTDFLSEEAITVIRQIASSLDITILSFKSKARAGPYFCEDAALRRNFCINPSFEHDLTSWTAALDAVGKAGQFTLANTEHLSIVDNPSLSTGDITFSLAGWVLLDTKSVDMTLWSKWLETGDHREYRLFFDQSEDRFRFEVSATGTSSVTNVDADTLGSPATGTLYFIVVWHDAIANTINIQVNNGTVDSVAHTTGLADKAGDFNIGAEDGGVNPFNGRMSNILFGKELWTADERTWLRNGGNARSFEAFSLLDDGSTLKTNLISY